MKNVKLFILASLTFVLVNCGQTTRTEYLPRSTGATSTTSSTNDGTSSAPSTPFAPSTPSSPSTPLDSTTPTTSKVDFHSGAAVVSGTRASFKLSNTLYFSSDDWSKKGHLFVALQLANGELYFCNSARQWTKYNGVDVPAPFASGVIPVNLNVVIADGENISDSIYDGAILYIGYGLSNTSAVDGYNEMLAQKRYLQAYRVL